MSNCEKECNHVSCERNELRMEQCRISENSKKQKLEYSEIEKMQYDLIYMFITMSHFIEKQFEQLDFIVNVGIEAEEIQGESIPQLLSFMKCYLQNKDNLEENKKQFCDMIFKITKMTTVKNNWISACNNQMLKSIIEHLGIQYD